LRHSVAHKTIKTSTHAVAETLSDRLSVRQIKAAAQIIAISQDPRKSSAAGLRHSLQQYGTAGITAISPRL